MIELNSRIAAHSFCDAIPVQAVALQDRAADAIKTHVLARLGAVGIHLEDVARAIYIGHSLPKRRESHAVMARTSCSHCAEEPRVGPVSPDSRGCSPDPGE